MCWCNGVEVRGQTLQECDTDPVMNLYIFRVKDFQRLETQASSIHTVHVLTYTATTTFEIKYAMDVASIILHMTIEHNCISER